MKSISALSHLGVGINELAGAVFREIGRTVREINLEKEKQENKVAKTEKAGYNDFNTLIRDKTEKEANHGADANRGNQGNGGRREEDPIQTGGGYQIPNLKCNLPSPESIGKYGLMRKDYLKKHKRVQYSIKLMEDTLTEHLLEVQTRAEKQVEMWEKAYLQKYPAPDQRSTPDGMGAVHEHGTDDGRGSGSSGGYLQLNLFPSVEEQLGTIAAAEAGMKITEPAAFFMQDEIIDAVLGQEVGKKTAVFVFMQSISRVRLQKKWNVFWSENMEIPEKVF